MSIVDNAVYKAGRRVASPASLEETFQLLRELDHQSAGDHECYPTPHTPCTDVDHHHEHSALAWIGLYRPAKAEILALKEQFGLHDLAVEDTVLAHQRPKTERYGQTLFTVLRPASYHEADEAIRLGEIHVFTGPNFVITVRHAETNGVGKVRHRAEREPQLLARGPEAVLYALIDQVVDDYFPILEAVEDDTDQIEDSLFSGESDVSQRIYELARQVNIFHRAVAPLTLLADQFEAGFNKWHTDQELQHMLRDVRDHVLVVNSRVESFRAQLNDAMQLDATLTAARQNDAAMELNEQTKKISAWAAILFAPSMIGSIYGMNFQHMPELSWEYGYAYSLVLMLAVGVVLYVVFKRKDWL
ncbi:MULTISPECIES: magnesium and cobalt transport protein CorA [Kocuria]|uniref:Magnesium and cobalt transport protein CorA n=1 Tax=Kocuria subflava TaxID=1736139 RepID=A0A846TXQ7_9MICC|nr:magnesium and cobalt transport protein CorA [Kocuria sp. CPCC 104605]NKE09997.1 magnesium and cobalt transport protein CorA [Kocuria subflava]